MKSNLPYNVMRHRDWDAAPRGPATFFAFATTTLGLGTVGATLFAIGATVAVTAVTSWALSALTPKPDLSSVTGSLGSKGTLVNAREPAAAQDFVYGEVRKGGVVTYYESVGTNNKFLHQIIVLAGHEVEEIGDIYLNDEAVSIDQSTGFVEGEKWGTRERVDPATGVTTYGDLEPKVRIRKFDGTQTSPPAELLSESSQITSDFVGSGIAYLYVRYEYDQGVFASGLPLVTAVVKGKKVFDPRTSTTAYSNNAALCLRDYLASSYGLNDDDIDENTFSAAANICDEQVALVGGGTESRYAMNGSVKSNTNHGDVLNRMVTSCAGTLFWGAGLWKLTAGAYSAPTKTLSLDDLRSPITLDTRNNLRDQFNTVQGVFNDADQRWVTADYPPVKSPAFVAEDGGVEQSLDFELPLTTSAAAAQRLAKMTLFRGREQMTLSADFGLNAFDVEVGEIIALDIDRYGWSSKEFEVIGWKFGPSDKGDTRITMSLRETSEEAFQWNAEESEIISNSTNLPDIAVGLAVSNLTVGGGGRTQGDGTFINSVILSWTGSSNSFVDRYEIQWKPVSDSIYSSAFTSNTTLEVAPLVDGVEYDFRVRAITIYDNGGPFSSTTLTVGGDTAGPGAVTNLTAQGAYQTVTLSYIPPSDSDWRGVNIYEGLTANFASSTQIGRSDSDIFIRGSLPNDTELYYWVETFDYTGNTGPVVGPVSATTRLLEENDFSQSLQNTLDQAGVKSVNTLPASGDFENQIVLLLSDFTLYRWDDTAGQWDDELYTAIEDNSVTTDSIVANAIVGSKIAAGEVTADKISVNELSAISANIGTFQSAPSGERVRITDDVIEVYDASGQIRVKIGNLSA